MKTKTHSPIKAIMGLNNISIKEEPVSDGEYLEKSSKKKPKSNRSVNKQDLISQLVSQEYNHLSKKKKRKSHIDSQESTPKKIKVEKQSEDERDFSRRKSDVATNRDLNNLFTKSDVQSSSASSKGLHNRHSLPKTKTSAKKTARNSVSGEQISRFEKKSETPSTKSRETKEKRHSSSKSSSLQETSQSNRSSSYSEESKTANKQASEDSSSSDQEAPKNIKRKTSKLSNAVNLETRTVHVPAPIKRNIKISQSVNGSSDSESSNPATKTSDRAKYSATSESSSEEEMPLPKLTGIKTETSKSPKVLETKKVAVPAPIKTNIESSESEESSLDEQTSKAVTKRNNEAKASSSESDNSDKEMPIPKLENIKRETRKTPKTSNLGTKKVAVPAPIQRNIETSESEESSLEEQTSKVVTKGNNEAKNSSSESNNSDQEMPVPKLENIKKETPKSQKTSNLRTKKVAVPGPIKRETSSSESEENSSDDESSNPPIKPNKPAISRKSETDSSSEEEPPMPKPKSMTIEKSKSAGKKKGSVPLPIPVNNRVSDAQKHNNLSRTQNNQEETASSSEEDVPGPKTAKSLRQKMPVPLQVKEEDVIKTPNNNVTRQTLDSDDEEVPQPKRIKLSQERTITPALKKQVPMPVILKQEESSESDANETLNREVGGENTNSVLETPTRESSFRERSLYAAMNWIEKLKYRFPGIKKQTLDVRLPETNAKYSFLLVPKNIDPQSLINLKCHMNKKTTVNLNGKEYVFEPLPKKPDPAVINVDGPKLLNLQSIITLQRSVPELTLKELVAPKRENISLPRGIKVRHPLFGVNYKPKLSIAKSVKKNLQEAMEQKRRAEEKEKKHKLKKRKNRSRTVEENVLTIFNSINTSLDEELDLFPVKKEENSSADISGSDKKKKHKHKKRDKEALEISQNSLSEKRHKNKKRESSDIIEDSSEYVHKKKKKHD